MDAPVLIDKYQFTIDTPAPPLGAFNNAFALSVGPDGTVYVFDHGHDRVQHFSADGNPLGVWGGLGRVEGRFIDSLYRYNRTLNAGPDGRIWIQEEYGPSRLQIFDRLGQFLESRAPAAIPGIFQDVAPDGSILFAQDQAIVRFGERGRELARWGSPGAGEGQFGQSLNARAAPGGA